MHTKVLMILAMKARIFWENKAKNYDCWCLTSRSATATISMLLPPRWFVRNTLTNHMMTSSIGDIFRVTGPLCGKFTGHRWTFLTKASDAELWYFLWSAPWINNREAGDLRRYRAHCDVFVMQSCQVTLDISGRPIDFQWGSRKHPG